MSFIPGTSIPGGVSGQPIDPSLWRGSLEVSEKKRNQIFTETKDVLRKVSGRTTTLYLDFPNLILCRPELVT